MKLSIIVPVYNAEQYLHTCLDSLLTQNVRDSEIILVNDGSRDGSGRILEEYRVREPERIRVLTVENGGQGRARNLALDLAQGDFIGFADSDDWVKPDIYEKMIARAEETGADLVLCDAEEYWPDGHRVYMDLCRYERPIKMSTGVCKLVRRSTLGDQRFAEGLWYEDLAYVARLLLRTDRIAAVPEPLYCYRCGHTSTMNNNNSCKNLDVLKIMDLLKTPMREAGRDEDFETLVLNHALLDAINRVNQQNSSDKDAIIHEIRDYVNREVPNLTASPAYRLESRNRRLVMWLNYHGLDKLSCALLKLKNG